jgi:hypothetical protein
MPYGKDFTVLDSRRPLSASDGGERIEAFACSGKPPGMGFGCRWNRLLINPINGFERGPGP